MYFLKAASVTLNLGGPRVESGERYLIWEGGSEEGKGYMLLENSLNLKNSTK
jgi:hypothetical protein